MEIIKRGINPDVEWWHGTCHYCNSEMKERRECLKVEGTFRDGDIARGKCPVCYSEFILYPPVNKKVETVLKCPWCQHLWNGTASHYESCPSCHGSFSFAKPDIL